MFIVPEFKNLDDVDYFALGKIDPLNEKALIISASFMKKVFSTDLYHVLTTPQIIGDELQYIFDLGSAFHCYVLEPLDFDTRYYVSDFKNIQEKRTFIKEKDFIFIQECYKNIKIKYPSILEESEHNEVAFRCSFNDVPYKAKIDKLIIHDSGVVEIVDLKSVFFDLYSSSYGRNSDGILWKLIKEMKKLHYDLQGYCYVKCVKEYFDYHKYEYSDIIFSLLLASKDSYDVKKVTFSSEIMSSGKEKFNFVFPQIKSFYDFGISKVEDSEYL